MSSSLSIQPISSAVLPAVLELDNLCFGKLWTLEAYQRELDSPNSELLGLFLEKPQDKGDRKSAGVAGGAGEATTNYPLPITHYPLLAIGCFWAILDEAHITLLAVHPDYQGQGLGQAMLWGLMQAARDRALERATLEVRASNQPAISLYSKFGFQLAGRRRRYYKDTNEDALILWRSGLQQLEFQVELTNWYKTASDRLNNFGIKLQAIASASSDRVAKSRIYSPDQS
jgi:[ribosomal protein S18]-alanine N-acetyltransferase